MSQELKNVIARLLSQSDFLSKAILGLVDGVQVMNKFFENPNIVVGDLPEDVWSLGGVKVYPTDGTAPVDTVSSSDAGDDQLIAIYGLDSDFKPYPDPTDINVPQFVQLNGQNKVTDFEPLYDVWRIQNVSGSQFVPGSGTAKNFAGGIYAYQDGDITDGVPNDLDLVSAYVNDGDNQTLQSQFVIPADMVGVIINPFIGMSRKQGGVIGIEWRARDIGSVELVQNRFSYSSAGTSLFILPFNYKSTIISEKTRLIIRVFDASDSGIGVSGGYTLILFNKNFTI